MDREAAIARERWKNEHPNEHPTFSLLSVPLTQEERDALDARLYGGHNELTRRWFGLPEPEPEPGNTADTPASESRGVSQPRASTPRQTKDISRKTRGGRITKNTVPSRSVANQGTRSSRQATPTPANAPMPSRQSKQLRRALNKPDDNTAQVPPKTRKRQAKVQKQRASDAIEDEVLQPKHHKTRQRKVYEKERASRRLAREPPQFGMFAEQSVAPPLHDPPLRNPSKASKLNSSGLRNRAPSKKKSIAVKGAKPQGISKSERETNRSKRSKQSGG